MEFYFSLKTYLFIKIKFNHNTSVYKQYNVPLKLYILIDNILFYNTNEEYIIQNIAS